jgi:hypothetical protein
VIPSGPFVLTSGQIFTTTDPTAYQPGAVAVQIQNSSGFLITVQIGGANYLIQPFAASTVPTNNSYQINVTPGQPQASFGALISFAWLQPGEDPPMADGPLTQGNTQGLGLLSAILNVVVNGGGQVIGNFLPPPPLGYVYALYNCTVTPSTATMANMIITSGSADFNYLTAITAPITLVLNGLVCATTVSVVGNGGSPVGQSVDFVLRYDLFPQPIS